MLKIYNYFMVVLFFAVCSMFVARGAEAADSEKPVDENVQVTFVELGSVKCIPCKQMQPVMDAIEKEYAGKVKVVFYDVWTAEGKEYGNKYGVRLIPTQVFLDKEGKEIFRHEGFLPKQEIEKVLLEAGVEK